MTWDKLYAIGLYDLGLSRETIGKMVIKEFNAVIDRYNERIKREEKRLATIMAEMNNVVRWGHFAVKNPKTLKPEDFFQKKKGKSWQEMLQIAEKLTYAFGGKDLRNKKKDE